MASPSQIFERTFRKFQQRTVLNDSDRAAFMSLPFEQRSFDPHRYLVREGDRVPGATLILAGLAYRHKVTVEAHGRYCRSISRAISSISKARC